MSITTATRRFGTVALACALIGLVSSTPASADETPRNQAPPPPPSVDCSATVLDPRPVALYLADREPYEYLVQAVVHITDTDSAAGCVARVCIGGRAEQSEWITQACGLATVEPGVDTYFSFTMYVDCQYPGSPSELRSFVRFVGSAEVRTSAARTICSSTDPEDPGSPLPTDYLEHICEWLRVHLENALSWREQLNGKEYHSSHTDPQ